MALLTDVSLPGPKPQITEETSQSTGSQTGTEHRRSVWRQGITVRRRFTAALTGTMTPGMRGTRQGTEKRESDISSGWKLLVEPEYFHILLCELRISLDQTRGDCGDKPTLIWWVLFSLCWVWMKCVLGWVNKAVKLQTAFFLTFCLSFFWLKL